MRSIRRWVFGISGVILLTLIFGLKTDIVKALMFGELSQQAKLGGSGTWAGDQSGYAVAISGDTAVVGAPEEDMIRGAAYVFVRGQNGAWTEQARLTGNDIGMYHDFGHSVAIEGDIVVVGAHGSYSDNLGTRSGAVYVYERNGMSWTQQTKLVSSDAAEGDGFGRSVGISGNTIAVGAPGQDVDTNNPYQNAGSVYLFRRDENNNWSEYGQLITNDPGTSHEFGNRIAISGDQLAVGAPSEDPDLGNGEIYRAGSAYVFSRDISGVWTQQAKLNASDGEAEAFFGHSVALHGDTLVVGAHMEDSIFGGSPVFNAGSVYVFGKDGNGNWVQQAKLVDSDPGEWENFGSSVAVEGNTILVGAKHDTLVLADCQVDTTGTVSLYDRNGATWELQGKMVAKDGEPWDSFGFSAAISGSTVLVGAIGADKTPGFNDNSGVAYVFSPDTLAPTVNNISTLAVLNENDILHEDVTQFNIYFSEDLTNPPGNSEQLDVTNPSNYSLIQNESTAITINSILYNNNCGAGPFIATVSLNDYAPLSGGGYSFSISGSNIIDQAGNHLAGDGNTAGTDFIRNFTVTPIIVDDLDEEFTLTGTWTTNTSIDVDSYQGSSRISHPGNGDAQATFTPNLPSTGTYQVSIWLDQLTNGAKNMPVTINHEGGSSTVLVSIKNEPINGGWVDLGTFLFAAGSSGSVTIANRADGFVFADAVKWDQQSIIASVENISDEIDLRLIHNGSRVMFIAVPMVFFITFGGWQIREYQRTCKNIKLESARIRDES